MKSFRLFVCATEFEGKILIRALRPRHRGSISFSKREKYELWEAEGEDYAVVISGIGPRIAKEGLEAALSDLKSSVHSVIGFGFCGGLVKTAPVGKLVIPTRISIEHENETPTEWLRMSVSSTVGDSPLRTLHTSADLVANATDKAALYAAKGVEAVDMESGAWGQVCRERGIPWVIVRSVMDTAEEKLPDSFRWLWDRYGNPIWGKVIPRFLTHPNELWAALRIQKRCSGEAGQNMSSALVAWHNTEREKERSR